MSYDNRNSGIITRNDKQGNEKRPDYRGSINVDGRDYWISAWIKTGRDGTKLAGQKYMSLSVEPKDAQPQHASSSVPAAAPASGYGSGASRPYDASGGSKPYGAAPAPKTSGTAFDDMEDEMPF